MLAVRFVFLIALLHSGGVGFRHDLGIECKLRGDRITVEAFFEDDTPAQDAEVTVRDGGREVIAKGRTDDKGRWSFARPQGGAYAVEVVAGGGHRAVTRLEVPPAGDDRESLKQDSPTRRDFTRTRWLQISLGLGAIGLLALGFWCSKRLSGRENGEGPTSSRPQS